MRRKERSQEQRRRLHRQRLLEGDPPRGVHAHPPDRGDQLLGQPLRQAGRVLDGHLLGALRMGFELAPLVHRVPAGAPRHHLDVVRAGRGVRRGPGTRRSSQPRRYHTVVAVGTVPVALRHSFQWRDQALRVVGPLTAIAVTPDAKAVREGGAEAELRRGSGTAVARVVAQRCGGTAVWCSSEVEVVWGAVRTAAANCRESRYRRSRPRRPRGSCCDSQARPRTFTRHSRACPSTPLAHRPALSTWGRKCSD